MVRPLSAAELLQAWEEGSALSPLERPLALLAQACPEATRAELSGLSIGERDARLLTLRELTFGRQLTAVAGCPECAQRLELKMAVSDITIAPPADQEELLEVELDGYQVSFRLPTSADLIAIAGRGDSGASGSELLAACIVSASYRGRCRSAGKLPGKVVEQITAEMARADPQAEVKLNLCCPACRHQWHALFDIASYLWIELEAWAHRTLQQVHLLASAYGWSEAEILAISPRRRQLYLNWT
jgi:hypothetical protein